MKYPLITSASNPQIRDTLKIAKRRRRERPGVILVEGPHLIEAALAAGVGMDKVFFTGPLAAGEEGRKILKTIPRKKDCFFEVADKVMARLADTESPQGIIAVASYQPPLLEGVRLSGKPMVSVVDGVQDPGNLGTIIRTSDAAGADAVVVMPGSCDPFMPKTIRASAGSVFNVPVVETDLAPLVKWLRGGSIDILVSAADAAASLYDADLGRPVALVFGNEAQGVSEGLREAAKLAVRIPIYGGAESLNVASAAAICLYEAVRQRRRS